MSWQLQEAKNRLSEVVKAAEHEGPQVITVRGKDTAVVLSMQDYQRFESLREPLGTYLARTAPRGIELEINRSIDVDRPVDL